MTATGKPQTDWPDGSEKSADGTLSRGSNSRAYLARRLQLDYPDVWQQYMAGQYRSVRAAAIAAGIVWALTPLERVKQTAAALSANDRAELLRYLAELA